MFLSDEELLERSARQARTARQILERTGILRAWHSIGAEVRPVGSLRMGLMAKHRDIDLHVYSECPNPQEDFSALSPVAGLPGVERITFDNRMNTEEACLEWHLYYRNEHDGLWQIDMIHLRRGSRYDGFFERMADRIVAALTPETRRAILTLKYLTPDTEHISGVEYYRGVLEGGVRTWEQFLLWRETHPLDDIWEWMPEPSEPEP